MTDDSKPRLVGINHVALEVGNVEEALSFYRAVFDLELRGSRQDETGRMTMAFLDMGDQFLAISEGRRQPADDGRHFGLVVDDKEAVRAAVDREGLRRVPGRRLDFYDPWGNRFEVVAYGDIQFDRVPGVKRKLGIEDLPKSDSAQKEIRDRGLA